MTSSFTTYLGLFLIVASVATGLIFRFTKLPTIVQIIVPVLLFSLTVWTPYQVYSLLGYPVVVNDDGLPQKAELLFAVPHENDDPKTVDLLLSENGGKPRMYEVPLTEGMKKLLKKAEGEQAKSTRTALVKKKVKKKPVGYVDTDGGEAPYDLLDNAFSLPKKDGDQ